MAGISWADPGLPGLNSVDAELRRAAARGTVAVSRWQGLGGRASVAGPQSYW
ncbi:hypothetical protein [Arthrobacter antibioticus]|uniref:hypothetical protein n=1 Tax=Arthrobacter sp. H35-MC1 TaxID=3046203 RepID=UPI0024B8CD7C|nr:hypothetical protein [Arthrobacter sp. H35-MC1]MDJ0317273.1 hypothetical protein [Arthrobacter sp. H35-MC1]